MAQLLIASLIGTAISPSVLRSQKNPLLLLTVASNSRETKIEGRCDKTVAALQQLEAGSEGVNLFVRKILSRSRI